MLLLGFPDSVPAARQLAAALGADHAQVGLHRFPDGESKLTLPVNLPRHVVFCRSLDRPNDKLIELLLAARTARELGAARLTLVAPYLCYMRQDMAFHPGEAVSQTIIGAFLAEHFDDVITVDPHLHRTATLAQAVPAARSIAVSAAAAISTFLRGQPGALLLGPDSESRQWVADIAQRCGLEFAVGSKRRFGDREVATELPEMDLRDRRVVLIDDMISSGETAAVTARHCLAAGAREVDVLVTHALFAPGADARLRQAGVTRIWSTDSVPHASNVIPLAPILAQALASHL